MKRIVYNKTFVRKIKVARFNYLVRQDKETQSLTIQNPHTKELLYKDDANGTLYMQDAKNLIQTIFKLAHIDRYTL